MMATFGPPPGFLRNITGCCSWSMMNRFMCRMASGWSRWVRMQVFSQRWSHTWPRIEGSGLSSRVSLTASRKSPLRTAFMYCGNLLINRALVETGGFDAVEETQRARRLRSIGAERMLLVAPIGCEPSRRSGGG